MVPRKDWRQRTGRRRYPGEPGWKAPREAGSGRRRYVDPGTWASWQKSADLDWPAVKDDVVRRMRGSKYAPTACNLVLKWERDDEALRAEAERRLAWIRREVARIHANGPHHDAIGGDGRND